MSKDLYQNKAATPESEVKIGVDMGHSRSETAIEIVPWSKSKKARMFAKRIEKLVNEPALLRGLEDAIIARIVKRIMRGRPL